MTPRARALVFGVLLILLGVIITAVTYDNAASSPSGGHYVVAFGPVIVGLRFVLRGLFAKA